MHSFDLLLVFFVLNVVISIEIVVQIDDLTKGNTVQYLDSLESAIVKSESIQCDRQNRRSSNELDTFLGINFGSTLLTVVLVIAFEHLRLDVVFKCHFDGGVHHTSTKLISDWQ